MLLIAALTTSLTIYQVIISILEEKFKLSHNKAVSFTLIAVFILGNLPCILAYGPWSDIIIFGRNIFDNFDFISGNIFFVLTALGSVIYVGWVLDKSAIKEINNHSSKSSLFSLIWFYYIKYIIPPIILAIFIGGFVIKI